MSEIPQAPYCLHEGCGASLMISTESPQEYWYCAKHKPKGNGSRTQPSTQLMEDTMSASSSAAVATEPIQSKKRGRPSGTRKAKSASKKLKAAPKAKAHDEAAADERTLKILADENPKRPGSESYKRFKLYNKASTVQEYLNAGGSLADIRWDVAHGFIKVGK